eukprot:3300014-Pyramimonas_sp.AAC.2
MWGARKARISAVALMARVYTTGALEDCQARILAVALLARVCNTSGTVQKYAGEALCRSIKSRFTLLWM